MGQAEPLTTTELLAAAESALLEAGYRAVGGAKQPASHGRSRLLQNVYCVVMVVAFETWENLVEAWPDYQNATVENMSGFLEKGEAKASDGYLVLLTPSPVAPGEMSEANQIRSDTSRLRKLLGTGDELRTISDVRKVIAPLLPLTVVASDEGQQSSLDALPRILEQHDIPVAATKAVVDAFKANEPIMPRLHELESSP